MISSYLCSGNRWFEHWKGKPYEVEELQRVCLWLETQFDCIRKHEEYTIIDVSPGGGRWTHHCLQLIHHYGVPLDLIYKVYGSFSERELTLRDAIKLFEPKAKYEKPCRVRTYKVLGHYTGDGQIISRVTFQAKDLLSFFNEKKPQPANFIMCFDSYSCYDTYLQESLIFAVSQCLNSTGLFICNVTNSCGEYKEFLARLEKNKLTVFDGYKVNDEIYVRVVKG